MKHQSDINNYEVGDTASTRLASAILGGVACIYGIYGLQAVERGSSLEAVTFLATVVGATFVLCPIISEVQDRHQMKQVVSEAEEILQRAAAERNQ